MATVAECWARYLADHIPQTVNAHANARYWGRLCWFADYDAERLSPKEVDRYVATRTATGATPGTINRELANLRAALRLAERNHFIVRAPIVKALPKPSPRLRALTQEEASRLIEVADHRGQWRERVYVRLALGTGARPGAIMDLTWDRVPQGVLDFRIAVPKAARMKRRAVVPANEMVAYALRLAAQHKDGDYVLNRAGRRLNNPRRLVKRLATEAGIKDVSPHVLRHTVASLLLQGGADLLHVSRLLGHASTVITQQVYFQHPPQWLTETTNLLKF